MENTEGLNLLLLLALGTFALLIMAVAVIFFVLIHQHRVIAHQLEMREKDEEMLRATIRSQEEERQRIGRDLHDDLGAQLSAVKNSIFKIGRAMERKGLELSDIDESRQMLDFAITQTRNISHQLSSPVLDLLGLAKAIETVCFKMVNDKLQVVFNKPDEYKRVNDEIELAVYRVVMELLNNIIKHSEATKAEISFLQNEKGLEITVSDNGKGFDIDKLAQNDGLGLKNIQSRLKIINGQIAYKSSGAGTQATIKVIEPKALS